MAEIKELRSAYTQEASRGQLDYLLRDLVDKADGYDGTTALHIAAMNGDAEGLGLLLGLGVEPNALDRYDKTALHRLREYRRWEDLPQRVYNCAVALLAAGCNPNRRDESGRCFYHEAAQLGVQPLFEALRDSKKRVNATVASTGETALHLACRGMGMVDYLRGTPRFDETEARYLKIVQCLLECGIDPEAETLVGKKALDFAVENRAKRIGAFLRDGSLDETSVAAGGMTLHQAAWQEDLAAIDALAGRGEDLDGLAEEGAHRGLTPLMAAASALRPGAAKALIAAGADPAFRDGTTGHTAMWSLCTTLNTEICIPDGRATEPRLVGTLAALLTKPETAGQPLDEEGRGALHLVCLNAWRSWWVEDHHAQSLLIPALIKAGADPNAADKSGRTPLHYLCGCRGELPQALAMTLLEKGARTDCKDGQGRLPAHYAAALEDRPAAVAMVETMLDFDRMDFTAPDNGGKTPMDLAAEGGNNALLKLMM